MIIQNVKTNDNPLKIAIITTVLLSGLAFGVTPVFAVSSGSDPSGMPAINGGVNQENRVSNLKNRASEAIDARIAGLIKLITRINDIKRLTSAQKTTLTGNIQTEISSLTTLKAKIDADTDLTTLRTDVQSIVKSFRVYVLYIPQTYIIAHADRLLEVVSLIQTLEIKLQTRVASAGNPAALTALLTDMTAKLTDAGSQAQNAINAVIPLTPDGWPANKTTLQSARTMLQAARQDIQEALHDAQKIRQGLRGENGSPSPTATDTLTETPTVTPTPTP